VDRLAGFGGALLIVSMDILTDNRHVSRLEVVDTGRRRRWPDEQKRRIVEESLSAPRQASATARRHGISNQLLFAWRKAYREGRLGGMAGFVPAMITPPGRKRRPEEEASSRFEVVTANGYRIIVEGPVNVEVLLQVVRGLESA
jgi:transposase